MGVLVMFGCSPVASAIATSEVIVTATETTTVETEIPTTTKTTEVPTSTTATTLPITTTSTPITTTSVTTQISTATTTTTTTKPIPTIGKIDSYEEINSYGASSVKGNNWYFQSFAPIYDYDLSRITIYGWCEGSPTFLTAHIREAKDVPIGSDIVIGTIDISNWGKGESARDWHGITMDSIITLKGGTQYALIISVEGDINSNFNWVYINDGKYANGHAGISTNGGKTFGDGGTFAYDFTFQTWGKPTEVD